ncbi:aldehyde dehydrogenase [Aeromonas diversa CDC 2478-85]|uniref:Aldehyde dehydrogenase n=1 Tax=Aeromonas diversa CDC 2478-85 TaxID=1268237 RepID=N9VB28_9GAMM|nr:aldehyde dehydrogenase [Aeromonas diversa]ENY72452.1 aldehyde dehydrogenase [Aeromonas diversa CDC 2478-85]
MTTLTLADWEQRAATLKIEARAFIDGAYVDASSGATLDCINPANGRLLAKVAACDAMDAERAVQAARRAFDDRRWAGQSPKQRKLVLQRFAALMREHVEELALLESLDMGKPIGDAISYDAPAAANCIAWNGEAIDKIYDEVAPVEEGALALVTREPLGIVAAIVPWNFPLVMACWKLGPALATGNSVILKPSEKSPLTAIRIAGLAKEAGIPDGVFNVLPGFGHTVGEALAMHMDVDCITFTGSTRIGKHLVECSGKSNLKRAFMECGGKSPNIVLADAPDLELAARTAAAAIFYNQGEVCTAASRLLVQNSIKAEFVARVVEYAREWVSQNPLDPETRIGAMVDGLQMEQVLCYIASGKEEGATLLLGGERCHQHSGGFYITPTIFDDVTPRMRIFREEIFGPVLAITGFDTLEEAIQLGNDTCYGLAAAVWTSDVNKAIKSSRALRAGTVFVNNWDGGDMTMPFGGYKQSGNGRDKSLHALEKYTELKSTWIQLD